MFCLRVAVPLGPRRRFRGRRTRMRHCLHPAPHMSPLTENGGNLVTCANDRRQKLFRGLKSVSPRKSEYSYFCRTGSTRRELHAEFQLAEPLANPSIPLWCRKMCNCCARRRPRAVQVGLPGSQIAVLDCLRLVFDLRWPICGGKSSERHGQLAVLV